MAGSSEGGLSAFTSGYQGGTGQPKPFKAQGPGDRFLGYFATAAAG